MYSNYAAKDLHPVKVGATLQGHLDFSELH